WANVALMALRSPGLHLEDVILIAGAGALGADGAAGANVDADMVGGNGVGITPGRPGKACATVTCTDFAGRVCGTPGKGVGAGGRQEGGAAGDPFGQVQGGFGGFDGQVVDPFFCIQKTAATSGVEGSDGATGATGAAGKGGSPGSFDPEGGSFVQMTPAT